MNGRVLVLVLVTGLFMAAWNGDQAAMKAALAKRAEKKAQSQLAQRQQKTEAVVSTRLVAMSAALENRLEQIIPVVEDAAQPDIEAPPEVDSAQAVESPQEIAIAETHVPLPPGIAAGEYRAVNQSTGETILISVSNDEAGGTRIRELYTVDSEDGDRWYLVRILSDVL